MSVSAFLPGAGSGVQPPVEFVEAGGHVLEVQSIPGRIVGAPTLVFLHEGLGSISMWRDFPQRVAAATGCPALVYSRFGYGQSARRTTPRTPAYMHDEALVALPELLDRLEIAAPVLIGHSDGGSIALIHAGSGLREVRGVVVLAPHEWVEEKALEGIRAARVAYESTDFKARLARYHRDPDGVFYAWNDTWLSPAFRDWNIEGYLEGIACPVLAIQGEDDEYATLRQIEVIAEQARDAELLVLADCRHSPHRDQPVAVSEAIAGFVARLSPALDRASPIPS
ncbi:MAG: alpha/beta hydrolase [Zoogloea sp.]|nr:alpha/beta hydrolase [Zoogloea sp.]